MAEGLTREQISTEALGILKALRDNTRSGKSNKLADVKSTFENSVSIEFDTYFFFLRKYHFIGMDREACLQLTGEGEKVLEGEKRDRFGEVVQEYFANKIVLEAVPEQVVTGETMLPDAANLEPEPEPKTQASYVVEVEKAPPPPPPASALPPPPPAGTALPSAARSADKSPPKPPKSHKKEEKEAELPPPPAPRSAVKNEMDAIPAPPAPRPSAEGKGQDIDLRYVKYDAMGQGPLGTVYRGRHTALGLDVCVKELKDIFGYFSFLQRGEVIKRLKKELCAQALVRHPGVLAVLDQNCDVARPYYVLELCATNLRARLDAAGGKGLPFGDAVRILLQVSYALRAAHAQGLVHANLKPENVLFDHYGNARVADFGLSRVIEVDAARGMPQVFVGTGGMGYMSPEQLARSGKDMGPASDVYSLGILLYEMLTGQLPGRRSPLPSAVNPEVDAKLDGIFDKMTQDRKAERYPDLDAMLDDFYAAFTDGRFLKKGDLILSSEGVAPAAAEPKAD